MKLLLIRHPEPDVTKGLCYGQTDVPLVATWQSDAQAIDDWLARYYPDKAWQFYHSPLTRTRLLAEQLNSASKPVEALKEVDFGDWENRLWNDIPKSEIDAWRTDLMHSSPYQGESLNDLLSRLMAWFESIRKADQDTVLVTHSGVIKVLLVALCEFPLEQCFRFNPTYSSITELDIGEGFALLNRLGSGDWTA